MAPLLTTAGGQFGVDRWSPVCGKDLEFAKMDSRDGPLLGKVLAAWGAYSHVR